MGIILCHHPLNIWASANISNVFSCLSLMKTSLESPVVIYVGPEKRIFFLPTVIRHVIATVFILGLLR